MPVNQLILTMEEYDKEKESFKLQENKYKFRLCRSGYCRRLNKNSSNDYVSLEFSKAVVTSK